uniref:Uncharacterized protein n=1 Tax=Streptomyces sp. 14R-10 TaxID=1442159 RepID=W0FYD5_9ACTN|nr:hypothetical protein pZL1.4c [Streptomyces sp. 14R-10]
MAAAIGRRGGTYPPDPATRLWPTCKPSACRRRSAPGAWSVSTAAAYCAGRRECTNAGRPVGPATVSARCSPRTRVQEVFSRNAFPRPSSPR